MYPFKPGSFAPRNAWYVVAFANEVGRALIGRTVINTPLAIYRKENGELVALDGRCPHRHFPLAKSCLEGDNVRCGYHGFAFGPDGQCVDIPSQAHAPLSYRVPTYPIVEHGLWVMTDEIYEHLVYGGAASVSLPALLPELRDKCIVVNGVAKTYAMTGWRVGWIIGPKDVVKAATNLQSHATSNVSNVAQAAAVAAVSGDLDAVATMREAFDRRRKTIVRMLNEIDHPEFGRLTVPHSPLHVGDHHAELESSPSLGQHNQAIYGDWLGLDAKEISDLADRGVI